MQNYIIISIIIAIIIFFLYKKSSNINIKEHFNNPTINLEAVKNIFSTFVNPQNTVSFNNIIAKNINAEQLNNNIVVNIDLSSNLNHGDILKYNSNTKIWENSRTVFPEYVYLNIYRTADLIQGAAELNLCEKQENKSNLKSSHLSFFPLDRTMDICSNQFYSYYGPYNNITEKFGLRFDLQNGRIFGFNPEKTYKIDCSLQLYGTQTNSESAKCSLLMKTNSGEEIGNARLSGYYGGGMTQNINMKTVRKNLPYEGIRFYLTTKYSNNPKIFITFWEYNIVNGYYNTTFTIYIQEITNVL